VTSLHSPATLRQRFVTALPVFAASVTMLLWASAFVAIRHVGPHFAPGSLALGRLLVGSIVLGLLSLARAHPWPARRLWPRIIVCGALWFGAYNVALNAAERRVDAGTAALVINIGQILLALLAGSVLREGFPRPLLWGSVIAFAGVAVISIATSAHTPTSAAGVALCVAAAAAYAVAVVAQKPLLDQMPALQVTWLACLVGTVVLLPYALDLVHNVGSAPLSDVLWMLYLGAFPTSVAFTTWAYALARTSAGRMGATAYVVPFLTVLLSWILLGQRPLLLTMVGGLLCLTGVYVTRRRSKPR
jgi:drug/metabolite transporter (DMT)-like permease